MGKLFYMIGKTSAGKDAIYGRLLEQEDPALRPLIAYTTRPIRARETDGVQYHFVTQEQLHEMQEKGKVIELRSYNTMNGPWYYFTADGEDMDMERFSYLGLGTLESFEKIRQYYGDEKVIPIYIQADDGIRLERYLKREKKQDAPNYDEICRRFLADQKDFSEENIREVGIDRRFINNFDLQACIDEVTEYIREKMR